jgi:hypothetical protein
MDNPYDEAFVKLTAKKGTWFEEGSEVYHYDSYEDDKRRISLLEYSSWEDAGMILVRGWRVCQNVSEAQPIGTRYFDGEACSLEEFEREIVDSPI